MGLAFAYGFRRHPEPAKRVQGLSSLSAPLSTSPKQSSAQKKIRHSTWRIVKLFKLRKNLRARHCSRGLGLGSSRRALCPIHLADLEPRKTPHRNILADLSDGVVNQLLHRQPLVLDEVLLVQTVL